MSRIKELWWQIDEALVAHKVKIIIAIPAIIGIILGVTYIKVRTKNQTEQAWTQLWDVTRDLLLSKRIGSKEKDKAMAKAISGYNYIINNLSSGDVAPLALHQLGSAYYEAGNLDEAIRTYQQFLNTYGNHYLAQFGRQSIGYVYEDQGLFNEAIEQFKKIDDSDSPFLVAQKNLDIARCYERLGSTQSAIDAYNTVLELESDPDSNWVRIAQYRLDVLR